MPHLRRRAAAALIAAALATAAPAQDNVAGSYLAGRHAQKVNDYDAAATYLTRAMMRDRQNPALIEGTLSAYLALGDVERAATVADRLIQTGASSAVANMVLIGREAKREDWDALLSDLEAGQSVGPLFDALIEGWALMGAGRTEDAEAAFDTLAQKPGLKAFALYHKALAQAADGRIAEAEATLAAEPDLRLSRRGTVARAEFLSQLDRNADAQALMDDSFGPGIDGILRRIEERLAAGETLEVTIAPTPADGVGEVFFSLANALQGEASPSYTLLYGRMTEYLRPDNIENVMLTASLLDELEQYDLAIQTYRKVPRSSPAFDAAELGRAEVMRKDGQEDAAIEVMRQLARLRPDEAMIQVTLGDALREMDRHAEALEPYDAAVALFEEDAAGQWIVYFARGISHERTDNWDEAEADFRKALELNPDQPQVLNYLGYSYVEKRINLDEALDMIERAVAARPDSGYITDSLGWVLYRLGRYEEAVAPMEKAVELMPVDPVINDHLGDVYWAVGRELEARFQWKRALSFIDHDASGEADPDRIRRKLEVGLDKVLEEEGAAPLEVATDDGG
ncbi:tetratricopeptide repeat protein [Rhodobacteraceae bacterium CCMM004]|nr:tetratricopeptide repeat protein [Rhodobacteraceae bacterium CCMM004]